MGLPILSLLLSSLCAAQALPTAARKTDSDEGGFDGGAPSAAGQAWHFQHWTGDHVPTTTSSAASRPAERERTETRRRRTPTNRWDLPCPPKDPP